jgi:SAM-dependent methyltransferase
VTYVRPLVYQDETLREVQRIVDSVFEREPLRNVLDAGCGYTLPLDFARNVRLVGLDASADALAKNQNIDVGIVGDIETYPLATDEYDVIVCWAVLEHLANPRAALRNMARALRPGGLLVVGIPDLWSLKGLVTKLTPHRFHVWVYRRIYGKPDAGKPGFGPYRTYLGRDIAPRRLERLARAQSLERIYASTSVVDLGLPRPLAVLWSAATKLGRIATLGAWDPAASEHVSVFRKGPRRPLIAGGCEPNP